MRLQGSGMTREDVCVRGCVCVCVCVCTPWHGPAPRHILKPIYSRCYGEHSASSLERGCLCTQLLAVLGCWRLTVRSCPHQRELLVWLYAQSLWHPEFKDWSMLGSSNSVAKNPPTMQETGVWSLDRDHPLEKSMTTHSSILAWKIHGQRSLVCYGPRGRKSRTRLSD